MTYWFYFFKHTQKVVFNLLPKLTFKIGTFQINLFTFELTTATPPIIRTTFLSCYLNRLTCESGTVFIFRRFQEILAPSY